MRCCSTSSSELAGQRNAIDGRIVEIVAEIDHDGIWGATGARSVSGMVAWKLGTSSTTADTIVGCRAPAARFPALRRTGCAKAGYSLDQVGVIASTGRRRLR